MSKRLPYYQSEPAEYLAGDIMFCSYAAQGVFSIIRALYWQRDCKLTLTQLKRRLINADDYIKELIDENIVKINNGNVTISFLDDQFVKAIGKSTANVENGKKGAAKRWAKSESNSESIAPPLKNDSEPIALKEDKIKEDNNYKDLCLGDGVWMESVCRMNKTKPDIIKNMLFKFESHLISIGESKKNLKEYKQHFNNWLRKKVLIPKRKQLGI